MRERSRRRLGLRVHAMSNRPALHKNDRVVPVLASHRGGQTGDELCFGAPHGQFKAARRNMMTFIHNEMPVSGHTIVHHFLANETLHQGNVQRARQLVASTAQSPNGLGRHTQKRG